MAANPQKDLTVVSADANPASPALHTIPGQAVSHSGHAQLSASHGSYVTPTNGPVVGAVAGTWTSVESLSREVEELRTIVSVQRDELEMMRRLLDNYRRDVDQSVLYLAQMSNDRWNRTNQMISEIRVRVDRYLNIGPFRILRALRRKLRRMG